MDATDTATEIPPYAAFAKPDRLVVDDATELAYGIEGADGDRLPLVFANGWSCSDSYWRWIVPPLAGAGHPCLVFDTRGHGESGLPRDPGRGARNLRRDDVSVPRLARDVHALVDHLGWDRSVLVGHSMGVQTVLESARDHDGRVAGLVAVAGSFENPLKTFYGLPFGLADRLFPVARHLVQTVPELLGPLWRTIDDNDFGLLAAQLVRAAGPGVTREGLGPYLLHLASRRPDVLFAIVGSMRDHSARDLLPDLDVPLLVMAAGNDTFTPASRAKRMAELAPSAEIVWFPRGHHTLPIEEPERIAEEILRFSGELG